MIDLNKDGVDHINIYSNASTVLGRYMSNLSFYSFELDGKRFSSVEHWWYYQLTQHNDCVSNLHPPFKLKKLMQQYIKDNNIQPVQIDKQKLKTILTEKILSRTNNLLAFINSTLPFKHYYVFGDRVVEAKEDFLIELWEEIRTELKTNLNILLSKYILNRGRFILAVAPKQQKLAVYNTVFTYAELKNELINKKVDTFLDDLFSDGAVPTKPDPFNESW